MDFFWNLLFWSSAQVFWHSVYLSVLLRCSGSHVVDFLHGLLVTVVWALSSEGFEFQCTTCWIWEGLHN